MSWMSSKQLLTAESLNTSIIGKIELSLPLTISIHICDKRKAKKDVMMLNSARICGRSHHFNQFRCGEHGAEPTRIGPAVRPAFPHCYTLAIFFNLGILLVNSLPAWHKVVRPTSTNNAPAIGPSVFSMVIFVFVRHYTSMALITYKGIGENYNLR